MRLDKGIAVIFLVVALIYGFAAFNYPLLPFERNMPFLPNTLPMALSVISVLLSAMILLSRKAPADAEGDVLGSIDLEKFREYKIGQALGLIAAMVLYALALRPVGFIAARQTASIIPMVSSFISQAISTKSDSASNSSRRSFWPSQSSSGGQGRADRRTPIQRMPKARARTADSWPIWPWPTMPRVRPRISPWLGPRPAAYPAQPLLRNSASRRRSPICHSSMPSITYSAMLDSCSNVLATGTPAGIRSGLVKS